MRKTFLYVLLLEAFGKVPKAQTVFDLAYRQPILNTYLYAK